MKKQLKINSNQDKKSSNFFLLLRDAEEAIKDCEVNIARQKFLITQAQQEKMR
jgi:hypothetical protein